MSVLESAAREAVLQQRCEQVLAYLIPDYKEMTLTQYENAITSLKTIARPIEYSKRLTDKKHGK